MLRRCIMSKAFRSALSLTKPRAFIISQLVTKLQLPASVASSRNAMYVAKVALVDSGHCRIVCVTSVSNRVFLITRQVYVNPSAGA